MGNYLYDGVRVYAKYDDSWAEAARFAIEGDSYYDPLTAMKRSGQWYYPLYDSLGSTRRLINASQSVTDTYSYDAFGNITAQSGTAYNPYRYVGSLGYYSADYTTGLLHLGARYYSPSHGRFTTQDRPRQPQSGEYLYAQSRPTDARCSDPTGLGPPAECDEYWKWCLQGYNYACYARIICTMFGNTPWSNCVRNCLLDAYRSCKSLSCVEPDHARCFEKCTEPLPVCAIDGYREGTEEQPTIPIIIIF